MREPMFVTLKSTVDLLKRGYENVEEQLLFDWVGIFWDPSAIISSFTIRDGCRCI